MKGRIVVGAAVVIVLALAVAPAAKRAWETARTVVAPGSISALRAAVMANEVVVVGFTFEDGAGVASSWRSAKNRLVEVEGARHSSG